MCNNRDMCMSDCDHCTENEDKDVRDVLDDSWVNDPDMGDQ